MLCTRVYLLQRVHMNERAKGHLGSLHIGGTHFKLLYACNKVLAGASSDKTCYFFGVWKVYAENDFCTCIAKDVLVKVIDTLAGDNDGYTELATLFHQFGQCYVFCQAVRFIQYDGET